MQQNLNLLFINKIPISLFCILIPCIEFMNILAYISCIVHDLVTLGVA